MGSRSISTAGTSCGCLFLAVTKVGVQFARAAAFLVGVFTATSLTPACSRHWPPALTGVTLVATDANGVVTAQFAARTLLAPPIPVIGIRPGVPPRAGSLLWNEPSTGRISITLARGVQSFTFHTTVWRPHQNYVIALFLNHEPIPAFVVNAGTAGSPASVAALDLRGNILPPQPQSRRALRSGFEVQLEELRFPLPLELDVVGPWQLKPDNIADAVGTVTLRVRDLSSHAAQSTRCSRGMAAALRRTLARFRAFSL